MKQHIKKSMYKEKAAGMYQAFRGEHCYLLPFLCLWFARLFFSKSYFFPIKCIAFSMTIKGNAAMNTLRADLLSPF